MELYIRLGNECFKIITMRFITFLMLLSCYSATSTSSINTEARELTPGIIKKEIRIGLSQADVVNILGSPNIITRDSKGKEVWVYDRISAEVETQSSSQYGTILILGFVNQKTKTKTTQKTLTLIITFDSDNRVENFSYHYSKF
jgi:outer membrane protein assembly factor BamE (lipoprotein component of BamABCDE complex)